MVLFFRMFNITIQESTGIVFGYFLYQLSHLPSDIRVEPLYSPTISMYESTFYTVMTGII